MHLISLRGWISYLFAKCACRLQLYCVHCVFNACYMSLYAAVVHFPVCISSSTRHRSPLYRPLLLLQQLVFTLLACPAALDQSLSSPFIFPAAQLPWLDCIFLRPSQNCSNLCQEWPKEMVGTVFFPVFNNLFATCASLYTQVFWGSRPHWCLPGSSSIILNQLLLCAIAKQRR